jgi:hypothetical protein
MNKEILEALLLCQTYVKGSDIAGVWINFPDKPEITLMDKIDTAIANYDKTKA